jgi:beta-galactosidase
MSSNDIILEKEWRFIRENVSNGANLDLNDSNWESVSIPHTWNAQDAQKGEGKFIAFALPKYGGYHRGYGWYRTWTLFSNEWKGKAIFLRFEAVSRVADVYINGVRVCTHHNAFSAFCIEITKLIKWGEKNLIAVRADNLIKRDNPPLSGDFPIFGGIYRPVHILIKNSVCITPMDYASPGVYLTQIKVSAAEAVINVEAKIGNFSHSIDKSNENYSLRLILIDNTQKEILNTSQNFPSPEPSQTVSVKTQLILKNPHLWQGLEDPYLYQVKCEILAGSMILDTVIQPLGLRSFHCDAINGFQLNGKPYFIHGVCKHQDRKDKGWAVTHAEMEEDIQIIKDVGARGIRLAHYQHPEKTYCLCDEAGILAWAEISLVNKVTFKSSFFENARVQLLELIRQNYNHPSIFCWGLCNEIGMFQLRDPSPIISKLHQISKQEDPIRYTTLASIGMAAFRKTLNQSTDLLGLNVYPGWYYGMPDDMPMHIEKTNNSGNKRGICLSEYGAGGGVTQHEQNPIKPAHNGPWHPEEWQCYVHEVDYRSIRESKATWGSFLWVMFDFCVPFRNEGDTIGTNDKGLVTYDRKTKKDVFYFYQANWSPKPMIYITSRRHVNRTDAITPVKVYSNCESVELKVNGNSLGQMQNTGFNVFRIGQIQLNSGENVVEVIGKSRLETINDQCVWILNKN